MMQAKPGVKSGCDQRPANNPAKHCIPIVKGLRPRRIATPAEVGSEQIGPVYLGCRRLDIGRVTRSNLPNQLPKAGCSAVRLIKNLSLPADLGLYDLSPTGGRGSAAPCPPDQPRVRP